MADKLYIKMCKAADLGWTPKVGDAVHYKNDCEDSVLVIQHLSEEEKVSLVWLPSQADLQEMWLGMDTKQPPYNFILSLSTWVYRKKRKKRNIGSIAIITLAFVMDSLYHKEWTGEKWEVRK